MFIKPTVQQFSAQRTNSKNVVKLVIFYELYKKA